MKHGSQESVAVEARLEASDRQVGLLNGRQGDEQAVDGPLLILRAQGDKVSERLKR